MKICGGQHGCNRGESLPSRPRDQQAVAVRDDAFGNRGDLLRALSRPKNHFREALTEAAVVIDPRKPNVFERCLAQNLKDAVVRCLRRKLASPDFFQQGL